MKIKYLKLRGFIGIKKGMGLDEIEIDLSGNSGLVAFDGKNGRGKSTVLDNLHPYRQLASRNRALVKHVFLPDSVKELIFEYAGDEYRTLIKMDADSERSEGYIWKNGQPQVDGKVSSYDRYVENLMGSPQLFFASVFCAQNATKMSDMTTSELKKLFSEFLRLEKLVEYENTARQCQALITAKISDVERNIERYQEDAEGHEAFLSKISALQAEVDDTERLIKRMKSDIRETEQELSETSAICARNAASRQRLADKETARKSAESEVKSLHAKMDADLEALRDRIKMVMQDISSAESVLAHKDEILSAAKEVEICNETMTGLSSEHDKYHAELSGALTSEKEAESERFKIEQSLSAVRNNREIVDVEHRVKSCRGKLSDLDRKDPSCASTTCSFIVGALKAQDEISALTPKLEALMAKRDADAKALADRLSGIQQCIESISIDRKRIEAEIEKIASEMQKIRTRIAIARLPAARKPEVDVAESRLQDLRKQQTQITAEGKSKRRVWDEMIAAKMEEIAVMSAQISEIGSSFDSRAESVMEQTQSMLETLKANHESETQRLESVRAALSDTQSRYNEKTVVLQKLDIEKTVREKLINELSEWQYLKAACSKDGLRALEIDSVAPIISGYANDLLNQTFGPQYSVKFRTQDPETGREVLDILVIREDGMEVSIDNLSGGERVWSLKALRLAMTLISKEKSGLDFETFFADEEDGALDSENARDFINMYRAFSVMGGFRTGFFISHRPECVSMADHVLRFGEGGFIEVG